MINGIVIREAVETDAAGFLAMWDVLDSETEFMMFEPGERQSDLNRQAARIKSAATSRHEYLLCALDTKKDMLVGFATVFSPTHYRDGHKATVVVGLMQAYCGKGIGSQMLTQLELWCRKLGLHRMQLTVSASNRRAIQLYLKLGFQLEGTQRHAIRLKSGFEDQHIMAKLLD